VALPAEQLQPLERRSLGRLRLRLFFYVIDVGLACAMYQNAARATHAPVARNYKFANALPGFRSITSLGRRGSRLRRFRKPSRTKCRNAARHVLASPGGPAGHEHAVGLPGEPPVDDDFDDELEEDRQQEDRDRA
jgi:hypothetical protein